MTKKFIWLLLISFYSLVIGNTEDWIQGDFKKKINTKVNLSHLSRLELFPTREIYPHFVQVGSGRVKLMKGNHKFKKLPKLVFKIVDNNKTIYEQKIKVDGNIFDYQLKLDSLELKKYNLEVHIFDGEKSISKSIYPLVRRHEKQIKNAKISLTLPASPVEVDAYPVTFGVPFPWGSLYDPKKIQLKNQKEDIIPIQTEITSEWDREGSIRWLLIDTVVPIKKHKQSFILEFGNHVKHDFHSGLKVTEKNQKFKISNGNLHYQFSHTQGAGIEDILKNKSSKFLKNISKGPYLIDQNGKLFWGENDPNPEVVIEKKGPIKTLVKVKGWHTSNDGKRLGQYILRHHIYSGIPHIFLEHSFIITDDSKKVKYKDIGYALPISAKRGLFGARRIAPYQLKKDGDSAYLWQRDDLYGKVVINGKFYDEFGKAEGWLHSGSFTLSVRDFWQNFPKELEAKPNQLIAHLWPAHNEKPIRTGKNLSIHNSYQLWFAHEGQLLDFDVPKEVLGYIQSDDHKKTYHKHAKKTNAMGLSKTHHLLLQINDRNWDKAKVRSMHKAFQWTPTIICDPQWIANSKVFGNIAAKDKNKFPKVEKGIQGMVSAIKKHNELDRDYGMFIFGDSHHQWKYNERRVNIYRLWRVTHHSWPRWPWLQYARSGDKSIFDYARRNANYVSNIGHCHYTTPEFLKNSGGGVSNGKMPGGICDYKGFVPWHAGDRLGYNSVADAMLHHFYFTGNRRSLDTAKLHGEALLGKFLKEDHHKAYQYGYPILQGREGSGRTISAIALFLKTWDYDYLEFASAHIKHYIQLQKQDKTFKKRPFLTFWTQHFIKFIDLTRSKSTNELILKWADMMTATGEDAYFKEQWAINMPLSAILASLSQAYLYSQNLKYLSSAAVKVSRMSHSFYKGEDNRFFGIPAGWNRNMSWSFYLTDIGHYLYAAKQHQRKVPLQKLTPRPFIPSINRYTEAGISYWNFRARVRQSKEGPFEIFLDNLSPYQNEVLVSSIDGKTQYSGIAKKMENGRERILLKIPKDQSLEYQIIIRSKKRYSHIHLPISRGQKGLLEVYPLDNKGLHIGGGESFYFSLQESVKNFTLSYQGRYITTFTVQNNNNETMLQDTFIGSNGFSSKIFSSKVPIKNWSLFVFSEQGEDRMYVRCNRIENNKSNPKIWLSLSPEKHFIPEQ